ncbi:MAG: DNA-processing protein DprA [Planctomycetota bacterium]
MPNTGSQASGGLLDTLTLARLKEVGPIRAGRLLAEFGGPDAVFGASVSRLCRVEGIGSKTAEGIARGVPRARKASEREIERAAELGARIVTYADDDYPPLLRDLPDRPIVLSVLGALEPSGRDRFAVGIVGSRRCSVYGQEQANRFGAALASAGLTLVSGGARGIDSAAHRGAVSASGRTAVVLGCGLSHVYPPENRALFDQIVESNGCIISELPIDAPPDRLNFPARNRIISGMSLGVLVIEAALKSGALITARVAAEDHGREVFALPGRVDSESIAGSLSLLKSGGAHLVTEPADVLSLLESPARHLAAGTHAPRYNPEPLRHQAQEAQDSGLSQPRARHAEGTPERLLLDCLSEPRTADAISDITGLDASQTRRAVTMLELSGEVRRSGSKIARS